MDRKSRPGRNAGRNLAAGTRTAQCDRARRHGLPPAENQSRRFPAVINQEQHCRNGHAAHCDGAAAQHRIDAAAKREDGRPGHPFGRAGARAQQPGRGRQPQRHPTARIAGRLAAPRRRTRRVEPQPRSNGRRQHPAHGTAPASDQPRQARSPGAQRPGGRGRRLAGGAGRRPAVGVGARHRRPRLARRRSGRPHDAIYRSPEAGLPVLAGHGMHRLRPAR